MDDGSEALAAQVRSELRDEAPQGFHFNDNVLRQDAALERLTGQLQAHPHPDEVARALCRALGEEREGWTVLKLLELTERLALPATAPGLMQLVRQPPGAGDRQLFLAGRASEVLLRLPLDYRTRQEANTLSQEPLAAMARFRAGAAKAQTLQRPRRIEWAILVGVMLVGLLGLALAFVSLDR